jgi:hypothetical protein
MRGWEDLCSVSSFSVAVTEDWRLDTYKEKRFILQFGGMKGQYWVAPSVQVPLTKDSWQGEHAEEVTW